MDQVTSTWDGLQHETGLSMEQDSVFSCIASSPNSDIEEDGEDDEDPDADGDSNHLVIIIVIIMILIIMIINTIIIIRIPMKRKF